MREVITTGKTVEEATELACAQLGLARDEVSIEILEMPQKKLFKTIPAKVKATADENEKVAVQPKEERPVAAPVPELKTEKKVVSSDASSELKIVAASEYLKDVCDKMGLDKVKISSEMRGEALIFKIDGPDVGALIGRRGETMEALSYLCSLVANRLGGDYFKIGLDVGGYREKREGDLESLARKVCDKVQKTNRAQMLEPMNPYERRIIHSAVSEIKGVRSESTGEGMQRRVVVLSTAEGAKNERPDRYDKSGPPHNSRGGFNQNGGFNQRGNDRPSFNKGSGKGGPRRAPFTPDRSFADRPRTGDAPKAPTRTESINDGANMPLYGKIEL